MKTKIAIFFTILFTTLLVVPTIISLVDDTQEITVFLDMNEEEEKKGESKTDSELKLYSSIDHKSIYLNEIQKKKNIRFYSKNYFSEFSKIDTPPPRLERKLYFVL